jgi:hypothetical protein
MPICRRQAEGRNSNQPSPGTRQRWVRFVASSVRLSTIVATATRHCAPTTSSNTRRWLPRDSIIAGSPGVLFSSSHAVKLPPPRQIGCHPCVHLWSRSAESDLARGGQNVATGLTGEPVPPSTAKGATVSRKVQRSRAAAASLTASRSQLSRIGRPMATMATK